MDNEIMKKPISILMAAILLSSCAWQDGGGTAPDAKDDKVMSVENAETGAVSALYEGYEELQGKQIGEHIIMPEVIELCETENIYTFKTEDNYDKTNLVERGTAFYKRFFGDDFNADRLYYFEYKDDTDMNNLSYNYDVDIMPEGIYDPNNADYGSYRGYPSTVMRTNAWAIGSDDQVIAVYDPVKDKDIEMALDKGKCTVGEVCETILSFFDREMTGLEGVIPRVVSLTYYSGTDRDKSFRRVFASCALEREGIQILNHFTPYWATNTTAGGEENTYYSPVYYNVILDGKDSIIVFHSSGLGPQKAIEINKLENVVSLKKAAELLDENLAEKLLFGIEEVSLLYCRKVTSSTDGDATIREFRPTWLFQFAGGAGSFNVDAISGEITIDASVDILNEMRRQQWN